MAHTERSMAHTGSKWQIPVSSEKEDEEPWSIKKSEELYNLEGWGFPYFRVNDRGHIEVDPTGGVQRDPQDESSTGIDLYELVQDLIERGHNLPLLIRFSGILNDRVRLLNEAFNNAIQEYGYANTYRGVFPVKVCQQRHVVEEVVEYGRKYKYGLEAGSKPELLIALATMKTEGALVTCNGYKDSEYLETALLARQLGTTTIIIIEKLHEVDLVLQAAHKLDIKPVVGVRARLSCRGSGHWGDTTGDRAKFGLNAADIVEVVRRLAAANCLDSLQLLHFHIGSQISNISVIKNALREAGQFYVQLAKLGCDMRYIDVGGGLGIDYDGSKTSFHASMNYTVAEYAADVVVALQDVCQKHNLPVPTIISESGRAVSSHQTVLVFSALHATQPMTNISEPVRPNDDEHALIHHLYSTFTGINIKNLQESFHDACQYKEEALTLFTLGLIGLEERAKCEDLYWSCCRRAAQLTKHLRYIPEELTNLEKAMSYIYYCNFSVFQSAPDTWAIDQLFPIIPIHRLDEKPTARGTLADLTCDSDGKIDHFITSGPEDTKTLLELHQLEEDKPYYMGMFLVGAYQEILGNLHNLYGDTNAVHIELDPDNHKGYTVEHVIKGDTTEEVLRFMQYDPGSMMESIRAQSETALKRKKLTLAQYRLLMRHFEKALRQYTYLWADV
eukprot:TRINITY_DN437_c0_g1_i1.p1 TRINITY_DN437_c0_g1~~TRINITY_DN437_c0_g1_i1.p1  ORF type:complete len:673 (-),score=226.38 TRINITY_DN437_c0_g1_i1:272-2290(-)